MCMYDKLGFAINLKKSLTVQTQRIRILGFVIDSMKRIVTPTQEKKQKQEMLVLNLLSIDKPTISYLTKVIGAIISCMLEYKDHSFIVIWKMTKKPQLS